MKVIDRARAHFTDRQPVTIEVPQWPDEKGNPTLIYAWPMTVKQREHLIEYERRRGAGLQLLVETILLHARDANADPIFSREDRPMLMNAVDPDILQRIGNLITEPAMDIAAIKKKSDPMDFSGSS